MAIVNGLKTQRYYTGNGVQTVFNFAMDYLRPNFMYLRVDGVQKTYGVDYLVTGQEMQIFVPPPDLATVFIYRSTSTDPLVSWADASVLRASDMTLQEMQLLQGQEEISDIVSNDIADLTLRAESARDRAVIAETNSELSADTAKVSEDNAKISEDNAEASELSATASAGSALVSKDASKVSEDNAKISEDNAKASEVSAIASASTATTEATEATTQADRAEALLTGKTVIVPTYPIGSPFPWFSSTRPDGTLICDGSNFDPVAYPKLALVYPNGILPDMRGVVPRGLDRGRGLDVDGAGRVLGSYQGDELGSHAHVIPVASSATFTAGSNANDYGRTGTQSSASVYPSGGSETRMKNIACDWLVYAVTLEYDLTINNGNAVTLGGYPASNFMDTAKTDAHINTKFNALDSAPLYGCRAWGNFNAVPLAGTYVQSGTLVTCTLTAHKMKVGDKFNVVIGSGTAISGTYTVASVTSYNIFAYTAGTSLSTSGAITRGIHVRASGNIANIVDTAVGVYNVTFSVPMVDAYYIVNITAGGSASSSGTRFYGNISHNADTVPPTPSSFTLGVGYNDTAFADCSHIYFGVTR